MDTDSRDRESVTEPNRAGWKWIPDQGVCLWWDGERYTGRAEWDGAGWQVGPTARPTPKLKEPPSRRRVVLFLVLAALAFANVFAIESWGYDDLERECQGSEMCLNEGSMGPATLQLFSLVGPWSSWFSA